MVDQSRSTTPRNVLVVCRACGEWLAVNSLVRRHLLHWMRVGLDAADPAQKLPFALPILPRGRVMVVAAGKAAAPMAQAVERCWLGTLGPDRLSGFAVAPDDHEMTLQHLDMQTASHPVPDARSVQAGQRALQEAAELGPDDLLLALISGGGSSLLAAPVRGITLAEKQAATRMLLASGVPIRKVNALRKALSAIKGGRLLQAAAPARVCTLLVSDVPGDDPTVIASGPTVPGAGPDLSWLEPYTDRLPAAVRAQLKAGENVPVDQNDPKLPPWSASVLLSPASVLAAVEQAAQSAGVRVLNLGDHLEGEARTLAEHQAALARVCMADGLPTLILSGGEAGVTVRGTGRGGRNGEFLLALALALEAHAVQAYALAMDTDGIDGRMHNAGAVITPDSLARARAQGFEPSAYLANNDSYPLFEALGDLVVTGPTRTNVNDLRMIFIA